MATTLGLFRALEPDMKAIMDRLVEYVPLECRDTMTLERFDSCDEWDEGFELAFQSAPDNWDGQGAAAEFVSITLLIIDASAYEGYRPNYKTNVELKVIGDGGRIFAALAPYNYTPDVWVPSRTKREALSELRERVSMLADAVPSVGAAIGEAAA